MPESQNSLPHGKPLVERKTRPPQNGSADMRGMLSIGTMVASLGAITIALGGGMIFVMNVLDQGLLKSLDGIEVKLAVLGFAFLFGWIAGLISIRVFGNQIYPFIIKIYAWVCIAGVGFLYIKVIQKLYGHTYDGMRFGVYVAILLGGLFALFFLHLLVEGHDLRPLSIPLLIISVVHLFVIVYHYVFVGDNEGIYALGDVTVFTLMIIIAGLMLMHIGISSPMRNAISDLFGKERELQKKGNGNGVR